MPINVLDAAVGQAAFEPQVSVDYNVADSSHVVFAHVAFDGVNAPTAGPSVDYGTQAMTLIASEPVERSAYLFALTSPETGLRTATATWTDNARATITVVGVSGLDTTPYGTPVSSDGTASQPALIGIVSASGGTVLDFVNFNAQTAAPTPGAGQTPIPNSVVDNSGHWVGASTKDGAASVSMLWAGDDAHWSQISVPLNAAPAPANQDPDIVTPISDISVPSSTTGTITDISNNFTDADGDTLTYSVSPALPAGMSLDINTGVISGNGSITESAAANYTFSADDGQGGSPANDIVQITVTAASLTLGSVTPAGPHQVGDSINVALSNASASGKQISIPAGTIPDTGQSASGISFDIINPLTFGDRTAGFNEDITFTVTDGAQSVNFTRQIAPNPGDFFGTIATKTGIWANAAFSAVPVGTQAYVITTGNIDIASGSALAGHTYQVYLRDPNDNVWSALVTVTVPNAATPPDNPATGNVVIDGVAQVGQTLTANVSGIADADGIAGFTYSWTIGSTVVSTTNAYSPVVGDIGQTVDLEVVMTDNNAEPYRYNLSTAAVIAASAPTPQPPTVATQPTAQTVTEGQDATFTVAFSGADSIAWYENGTLVNGETGASLTLTTDISDNGNQYFARATNTDGSVDTNTVTLTVNAVVVTPPAGTAPVIDKQNITAISVNQGQTYSDPAWTASDDNGPVAIQWTGADVNTGIPGTYTRVAIADNAAGLTTDTLTVTVVDTANFVDAPEVVQATLGKIKTHLHNGNQIPVTDPKDPRSDIWRQFTLDNLIEGEVIVGTPTVLINDQQVAINGAIDTLELRGIQTDGNKRIKVRLAGGTEGSDYTLTVQFSATYTPSDFRSQSFSVKRL